MWDEAVALSFPPLSLHPTDYGGSESNTEHSSKGEREVAHPY